MNLVERLRKKADMSDQEWQPKLRALLLDAASHIESQDKRIRELEGALKNKWLAFDIGCIECGEESAVIGLYPTKEQAEAACDVAKEAQSKNWTGQHNMEVFELPLSEGNKP